MDFFAGEAIDVGAGQRAAAGHRASKWVVPVAGGQRLAAVDKVGDIAAAVGMIKIVCGPVAAGIPG